MSQQNLSARIKTILLTLHPLNAHLLNILGNMIMMLATSKSVIFLALFNTFYYILNSFSII